MRARHGVVKNPLTRRSSMEREGKGWSMMRARGMQALRIRYEGRYLGSCWDEKRFKGEDLFLLFNSCGREFGAAMRNKNVIFQWIGQGSY